LPINSVQNSRSPSPFSTGNIRLKTFKITDQELNAIGTATPIKVKVLHDNEVVCTHQTSENSFITICTLTGKLVTLSIHLLQPVVSTSNVNSNIIDETSSSSLTNNGEESETLNNNIVLVPQYVEGSEYAFNIVSCLILEEFRPDWQHNEIISWYM
jgi:hypothetical protein